MPSQDLLHVGQRMPRVFVPTGPTQRAAQIYLYGNGLRSYLLAVVVPSQGERLPPMSGTCWI